MEDSSTREKNIFFRKTPVINPPSISAILRYYYHSISSNYGNTVYIYMKANVVIFFNYDVRVHIFCYYHGKDLAFKYNFACRDLTRKAIFHPISLFTEVRLEMLLYCILII